jgi:hypothetical protein
LGQCDRFGRAHWRYAGITLSDLESGKITSILWDLTSPLQHFAAGDFAIHHRFSQFFFTIY